MGMACCILILMHVIGEYSYDRYHKDADQVYRVALERKYPDNSAYYAIIPTSFAGVLKSDYPEVLESVRIVGNFGNTMVTHEEDTFEEKNFVFADPSVLDIFDLPLIRGDKESALKEVSSVIMTESNAIKYFGSIENALGKVIETDFSEHKVTAIARDLPEYTHLDIGFIASIQAIDTLPFMQEPNFISFTNATYIKLKKGTSVEYFEEKLDEVVNNYAAAQIEDQLQVSWDDYSKAGNGYDYFLQPLMDIHLHSNLEGEFKPNGNITYVYIFISIAVFILIIACINFMNLATARSAERAREVGVRKVMGSMRSQLIYQFLTESVLLSIISFLLSIILISIVLPQFNILTGKHMGMELITHTVLLPLIIIFSVLVGLLAGSYPALILSAFNPVVVLKGKLINIKGSWLRNGLVVFQFWISIVLVAATMIIYQQMKYMKEKPLGFDKENVLVIEDIGNMGPEQIETFKTKIEQLPGVLKTGSASTLPGSKSFYFGFQLQPEGATDIMTGRAMVVDDDFIDLMGIIIKEGRSFNKDYNDSLSIMLNQTATTAARLNDPIGSRLSSPTNFLNIDEAFTVVGVVEDFNFQSLHDRVRPLVMIHEDVFQQGGVNNLGIRFKTSELNGIISGVEQLWKELSPGRPYQYFFLNDDLESAYQNEQQSGRVFAIFTSLAILIACIGLFGLSSYTTQQRTKEIGVRKVLGASAIGIVLLLSKDFSKLIILAFVLAVPVCWLGMRYWLEGFAYSIDIEIWVFLIAGILSLLVALVTISYQALKAATVNPVKSLKYE